MKFKLSLLATLLSLSSSCFASQEDLAKKYDDVLITVRHIIETTGQEDDSDLSIGVSEVANAMGKDQALQDVGYLIKDITGDDIPELLIGSVNPSTVEGASCKGNEIYIIMTLENGKPKMVFEGWGRNLVCTLPGYQFLNQGSGGAANSFIGKFSLNYDASEVSWIDYYYTYPDENNVEVINFYRSKNGEMDPESNTKLDMNYEKFDAIGDSWAKQTKPIEGFIPFANFNSEQENNSVKQGNVAQGGVYPITVKIASNELSQPYEEVKVASSEPSVKVLLSANQMLRDFNVLSLEFESVDDNGNVKFKQKVVKTLGDVSADKNVLLTINFIGSIPNNGISFIDQNGVLKKYSISESGQDGSLILTEFK